MTEQPTHKHTNNKIVIDPKALDNSGVHINVLLLFNIKIIFIVFTCICCE